MRYVGVFNRDGGTFKTTDMAAFSARAVEIFAAQGLALEAHVVGGGQSLMDALRQAATVGDVLVAGGGDGTISAAAAVAYKQGIPLAVVPAGTMNLFARSLGLPLNLEDALAALAGGEVRNVDIATANNRPFIHQFSVGIHPKLVKLRESLSYKSRIGKMLASTRAAIGALLRPPNFIAEITTKGGMERRSAVGISVSNNPFEGPIPHAERLDAGVLGIYVVAPLTPWVIAKLCLGLASGKWKQLPEVIDKEARAVSIRFPRKKANALAVIDGELIKLANKVALRIHPGALKVIVPRVAERETPKSDAKIAST